MSDAPVPALKVWAGEYDWYVAVDVEHVRQLKSQQEYGHPNTPWGADDFGDADEWVECDLTASLTIEDEAGELPRTRTLAEWLAVSGPGFLCSENY